MLKLHHVVALALLATPGAAFAEPTDSNAAKAAEEQKMVCRRIPDTSSLARSTKVCRTRKDWKAVQEASRKEATDMTQSVNASSSN